MVAFEETFGELRKFSSSFFLGLNNILYPFETVKTGRIFLSIILKIKGHFPRIDGSFLHRSMEDQRDPFSKFQKYWRATSKYSHRSRFRTTPPQRSVKSTQHLYSSSLNRIWPVTPLTEPFFRKQCCDEGRRKRGKEAVRGVARWDFFLSVFRTSRERKRKEKVQWTLRGCRVERTTTQRALDALSKHAIL